jgi:predicted metalloprotease with PDZ domain
MTHLAFPSVARDHDWAEEGLATYVEPFARVRAGTMTAEAAWLGLIAGLPNGLPAPGDRGLDHTRTWGRTYWGGALFYLLADIDVRSRTNGKLGLEHALRGILAAGGNNAQRWSLDDAFSAADAAIGAPVLRELHAKMGSSPHPVDLDEIWHKLGIVRAGRAIRFDDSAPLASIRRAITGAE